MCLNGGVSLKCHRNTVCQQTGSTESCDQLTLNWNFAFLMGRWQGTKLLFCKTRVMETQLTLQLSTWSGLSTLELNWIVVDVAGKGHVTANAIHLLAVESKKASEMIRSRVHFVADKSASASHHRAAQPKVSTSLRRRPNQIRSLISSDKTNRQTTDIKSVSTKWRTQEKTIMY